jgi:DNA repair protein RecO (recombination protein O)
MPALRAVIWRRSDFRESSRLVTLITREEGRVPSLAKGAHRAQSPLLGRIDFLNLVDATLTGRPGTLRLLRGVRLLHEPRGLRQPARYAAASWLAEMTDAAFVEASPDPALFDLLVGGITLLERAPLLALPTVLAGLELRFLGAIGRLPDLERCAACGRRGRLHLDPAGHGLLCGTHATPSSRRPEPGALAWLTSVERSAGREWAGLPLPRRRQPAFAMLGGWVTAALERRPLLRALALQATSAPAS